MCAFLLLFVCGCLLVDVHLQVRWMSCSLVRVIVWLVGGCLFFLFDGSLEGDDLHANVRVRVLVSVLLGVLLFLLTGSCVVI